MQKNKKYMLYFGIFANLLFAIVFIASAIDYRGWDTLHKVNFDNWLATDEKFLHMAVYEYFPVAALVMIMSAIFLWRLRK